jgi:hypothetical protein
VRLELGERETEARLAVAEELEAIEARVDAMRATSGDSWGCLDAQRLMGWD